MKVYTLQRVSDGMYFRGGKSYRGWGTKPRIYTSIGYLKQSVRGNKGCFPELDHIRTYYELANVIAAFGGNILNILPGEKYTIKEIEI